MAASSIRANAPRKHGNPEAAAASRRSLNVIQIDIANHQRLLKLNRQRLRRAVRSVLAAHGVRSAELSIAIVDDATIHELNRRYLNHDYATDVLSFALDGSAGRLDGEIVASAETAARTGRKLGLPAERELLLYLVHGALHLVGFDDKSPAASRRMRAEERRILEKIYAPSLDKTARKRPRRTARAKTPRSHG